MATEQAPAELEDPFEGEMEGVEVSNSQQIVCEGENGDQGREGGGGETAGQDIETWYQDVESRQQLIPDSCDKYKPTCNAIEQLQSLLQEVVDRQHSLLESGGEAPVDPTHLLGPLSAKQESLFQGVVHFHRLETVGLEQSIGEAERMLVESPLAVGYVDQQQKLHQLRATREGLTSCEEELHSLLEGPQPMSVTQAPLEQQETFSPLVTPDDSASGVFSDLRAVRNQAEMLLLRCQDVEKKLDEKIEQLEDDLQGKKRRFLQELVEVESWLAQVYGLLRADANHDLRVSASPEREVLEPEVGSEEDALSEGEEGDNELGKEDAGASDPGESYGSGEELVSDDSLGSPGMGTLRDREWDSPVDRDTLETSVDVELEDEEYGEEVLRRVISPEGEGEGEERGTPLGSGDALGERGLHPAKSLSPPALQGNDVTLSSEQQVQDLSQVLGSPVDLSSADLEFETASVSSESTLRSEPHRRSRSPEDTGEGGEVGGVSDSGETTSAQQEAAEVPEAEDSVLEQEAEPESPLPTSEGGESGPAATTSSDSQSDRFEHVLEDELQWVEGLRLVPMEVQLEEWERDQPDFGVLCNEANSIVDSLESSQEQLSTFFHKVKGTMAHINFVINAVSTEMANELRARLAAVKQQWEPLGRKMKYRIAQLKFEMAQRETLEALHEAVQELQSQPRTNLMPEEVEGYYRDCLEFFISVDQFESQEAEHLSQLETTLLALVEFPSEDHQLFRDTVDQLRQGYEAVAEKLRWQMAFLTRCRSEWSAFLNQISHFEDWLAKGEELVFRDGYGYSLQDTEKYLSDLKRLKEQLPVREAEAQKLVDLGNEILQDVDPDSEAEKHVDTRLSETTERWYRLVGQLDTQESAVNKVLINWKAYVNMHHGVQAFISRMGGMVGSEPLESSGGDNTLLPQYRTYVSQLKAMQVQLDRMLKISDELVSNEGIGGREAIAEEVKNLKIQWEPLKDNVYDSLDMLQREHNDWVRMKLRQMATFISQASDIVQREVEFVESYPLEQLLKKDAVTLLREVDQLVASQDQLNQLETDCVQIEEDILERQIQQETIGHPASELDSPENAEEKRRLQKSREELQNRAELLLPLLNVFFLQLQLLQKLQEGQGVVTMAMDAVGNQAALEVSLTDTQLKLSEDWFDQLLSSVDDLGDVSEEYEATTARELPFSAPPYAKVVELNHALRVETETLKDNSDAAMVRLQLFIEWWADYTSNHGDLTSWLDDAESQLQQLMARGESTQSPLVSPAELLDDMKELKEEMDEKETVMSALTATGQSIIDEMESKGAPRGEIGEQLPQIKARWDALRDALLSQLQQQEEAAGKFESYLTSLSGLLNWMSEFDSTLVDELCVQIPNKASEDTVARHRAKLEGFRREVRSHTGQFESLQDGSEQWGEHLIPDDYLNELPSEEESAASSTCEEETDFPLLPYIRLRMKATEAKWSMVQQRLRDRQDQLEMSLGNVAVFLEGVEELVAWIREKLQLDALSATPPANLELLKGFLDAIQAVRVECVERDSVRLGLVRVGEALREQVSGLIAAKVAEALAEVNALWKELQETLQGRGEVLGPLVLRIEAFWFSAGDLEAWLQERQAALTDCGPIGANLPRLGEQETILTTLDEEVLNKKRVPEDVFAEAMNIIRECQEGSGEGIRSKAQELQNQFDELSQRTLELRELCEEATSAMQEFKKKSDQFSQWLESMEGKLAEWRATKEPIGTITSQLEDHYDFMRDNEQQTDQYAVVHSHGNKLSAKYKPSDWLDAMMSALHQRWEEHVEEMVLRCKELLGLMELWNKYEAEVKALLSWIMDEAEGFSREVTTEKDKGISGHIKSCEALSASMEGKKAGVEDIKDLAEVLRAEDGEKKNGTSDVESRWNDVHQHWNSLQKLLEETLLRFRATYAEVCEVLQITDEQFDWLKGCELAAGLRQASRGDLQTVQDEIERHQLLLEEVQAHENEAKFIRETADFLLEHSEKSERQGIQERVDDFSERYQNLLDSLSRYVPNLQDSVPLWKEFNDDSGSMLEWLDHVQAELDSDHLQPGNATVTETSLKNAEDLQRDISDHKDALVLLSALAKRLSKLVIPADQDYIRDRLERIQFETQNASQQTNERFEVLTQRLRSWEVFPVDEARVVQDFLEKAQGMVEGEIEEEISAAQLQERLETLESLQQMQSSNQDKVSTIDQSVDSEDMRQALEKNPDISKERTNLLQGWSSMSAALKERIQIMKKRAEMVTELEEALSRCSEGLRAYRGVLETPLPPSVVLETTQQELERNMSSLHNSCQTSLTNLSNLLDHHFTLDEVPIPARLQEQAATLGGEFQILAGKAAERTNEIADILASWEEFRTGLQQLSPWLRSSLSELNNLKAIQLFLLEFASLEGRLKTLSDEVAERQDVFDRLKASREQHLFGEEDSVRQLQETFSRVEQGWMVLTEGVHALPEAMAPWKDLTDRFDDLSDWFDRLEGKVERDLAAMERQEVAGGDLSDFIVAVKDHLLKMEQWAPKLQELNRCAAALLTPEECQRFGPAGELQQQCGELEGRWDTLREKLQAVLRDLEDKAARWKEEALHSMQHARTLQPRVIQLTAQLEAQKALVKQLGDRVEAMPLVDPREILGPKRSRLFEVFILIITIPLILWFFLTIEGPLLHAI